MSQVRLNIGGVSYEVSAMTLKHSAYFCNMTTATEILSPCPPGKDPIRGADWAFVDRDGELFRHILIFLRDPGSWRPDFDSATLRRLEMEAIFFQVTTMVTRIQERLVALDQVGSVQITSQENRVMSVFTPINPVNLRKVEMFTSVNTSFGGYYLATIVKDIELLALFDGYQLSSTIVVGSQIVMSFVVTPESITHLKSSKEAIEQMHARNIITAAQREKLLGTYVN